MTTTQKYIDPRGVQRRVIAVDDNCGDCTKVTFECGHVGQMTSHFHYKVGNTMHCFTCGKEAREAD